MLFSCAEFLAEVPAARRSRSRKKPEPPASLFFWALTMEREQEAELVGAPGVMAFDLGYRRYWHPELPRRPRDGGGRAGCALQTEQPPKFLAIQLSGEV